MNKLLYIAIIFLLINVRSSIAQHQIHGKVYSDKNIPLSGVTISNANGDKTTTDIYGVYEIEIDDSKTKELIFSFGGWQGTKIKINNEDIIDVILKPIIDLSGQVTDENSGKYLIGVKVSVKNTLIETTTYEEGLYEIEVPNDTCMLMFEYPGMQKKEIQLTQSKLYNIKLSKGGALDVTISSASKKEEKISNIPASVVIISKQEIEASGYLNLEEILKNVPGLYIIEDNNWTAGGGIFGVRGFYSVGMNTDMIILVNGVNQYEDYWGFYPLSRIDVPVESINRIEIVRGPMSVIYGSGAFFGSINIVTDEVKWNQSKQTVSAGIGMEETNKIYACIEGQKNNINYSFNASAYNTGGQDEALTKYINVPTASDSALILRNPTSKGLLEDHRKFFNFSIKYKEFSAKMIYAQADKEMFINGIRGGDGNLVRLTGTNVSIGYDKKLSQNISLGAKVSYSSHRSFADYIPSETFGLSSFFSNAVETEVSGLYRNNNKTFDITLGLFRRTAFGLHTTFDLPIFGGGSTNAYIRLPDKETMNTNSAFLQVTYKLFDKLTMVAGARVEQIENYDIISSSGNATPSIKATTIQDTYQEGGLEFVPRLALVYSLNEKNFVKLMYGKATKRPSFGQNTDLLRYPDLDQLKAATIETVELNYIANLFDGILFINTSLYINNLDKLIERKGILIDGNMEYISSNFGKIQTKGVELGIKINIKKFIFDINANYNASEILTEGYENIDLAYAPKFLGYSRISYIPKSKKAISKITKKEISRKHSFSIVGRFVDEMETEWDQEQAQRIAEKTKQYFVADANIRLTNYFVQGLYFNLKINNITNVEYNYPTTANNSWASKGFLGQKTNVFFSIGFNF